MCGIFGIVISNPDACAFANITPATNDLLLLSESRGKEAAGILTRVHTDIHVYKEPVGARSFLQSETYRRLLTMTSAYAKNSVIIGQTRLATNGLQTENKNNQPVVTDNTVGVHNGIIVNDHELWSILKKKPKYEVDTEVIFELINRYIALGYSHHGAIQKMYARIEGSASLAMVFADSNIVAVSTNTGSLYYCAIEGNTIFASEECIVRTWMQKHHAVLTQKTSWKVEHLRAGSGALISMQTGIIRQFDIFAVGNKTKKLGKRMAVITDHSDMNAKADENVLRLYRGINSLAKLKKHDFDYKTIYALRRCTKCILPETTPFISFDTHGVCNYCHEHKKIQYKGRHSLETIIAPYRSNSDKPDCIIAFSGGRDSSYGLHFLKKELNLNPIAYTYDWGMVKDIARRNEARLVGKLGVEHIIVSADITMKRNYIRKNILAWMKKPDLGMVPLFMVGDKQCEFYADKLAKQNNIKLVFFCRGNELEKEEFKTGQCGIKNADPGGVIHDLRLSGKIQLAAYYTGQFMANPSYLNSSLFDTAFGYFSTYIQKHNYIFLWHYIQWDEKKILSTLKKEYNWETSKETIQTWRTDDGTSPFYNYIYYTGQGFTENDSFRSRQIREGTLSRRDAMEIVNEENKPQYGALQWYFDQLGLDGDEVLSVVDAMPLKRRQ